MSLLSGAFLVAFACTPAFSQDDSNRFDSIRKQASQAHRELEHQAAGPAARPKPLPTKTIILYISPSLTGNDKTDAEDRAWQEAEALRKQGYTVIEKKADEQTILDDLWKGVDAIAFFGHGGTDSQGNAASTFASKTAQSWKSSISSDFLLRYMKQGFTLEQAQAKTQERLGKLGVKMMRNFSCRSSHDKDIAQLFVRPGGKYYGVPDTLTGGPIARTISDYSPSFCSGLFGYSFELALYVVGEEKPAPEITSEAELKPTPVPAPAPPPAPAETVKATHLSPKDEIETDPTKKRIKDEIKRVAEWCEGAEQSALEDEKVGDFPNAEAHRRNKQLGLETNVMWNEALGLLDERAAAERSEDKKALEEIGKRIEALKEKMRQHRSTYVPW